MKMNQSFTIENDQELIEFVNKLTERKQLSELINNLLMEECKKNSNIKILKEKKNEEEIKYNNFIKDIDDKILIVKK